LSKIEVFKTIVIKSLALIKNMSIIKKMVASFVLVTICLFAVFYIIVYQNYYINTLKQTQTVANQFYGTFESKLGSFVNQVFSSSNEIYNSDLIATLIAKFLKENDFSKKELIREDILEALKTIIENHQAILNIHLYINKEHLYVNKGKNSLIGEYILKTDWYQAAFQASGNLVYVPTYEQRYSVSGIDDSHKHEYKVNVFSFIRLIKGEYQKPLAVLSIDYEENYISGFYDQLKPTNDSFSIICLKDGKVLSSNDKRFMGLNIYDMGNLKDNLTKDNGSFKTEFNGKSYQIIYNTFYVLDWIFITFVPTKDLLLDEIKNIIFVFIGLYIISNTLIGLLVIKVVTNPLKNLLKYIDKIKNGDFSSRIQVEIDDEIGHIGKQFNEMVDSIETLLKENYIIKLREKEAQIKMLQAQINPHFLYNILDIIGWKAMLMQVDDIKIITSNLGKLLRYSISNFDEIVSLEQDIQQVKNYLYIQQTRYTNRFHVHFKIDPDTQNLKVPKLLIQPIVENAVRHGLENKEIEGLLYIKSKIDNNMLVVHVVDNGCGIPEEKIQEILSENHSICSGNRIHIGIKNTHERIRNYYDERYGITIKSCLGKYTKVTLHLPIILEI